MEITDFLAKFDFKKASQGFIGIEREWFLTNDQGKIVPESKIFLDIINDPKWTYELSACQVEDRTVPQKRIRDVRKELLLNNKAGRQTALRAGLNLISMELAPEDMSLDVYPDPRYLKIVEKIDQDTLRAGCRVAGTHIHVGMPDIEMAIRAINALSPCLDKLCLPRNGSNNGRLELYKVMAPDWKPPIYRDAEHLFSLAQEQGFADNPRNCWHLIRISIHGTVEVRSFGATANVDQIIRWVELIRSTLRKKEVILE